MFAPNVAKNTTPKKVISADEPVFQAAGGTTTSEGKGINELSMAMKMVTVQ
jgi:hypothetical protein